MANEPMTDERLAEIRARAKASWQMLENSDTISVEVALTRDALALLTEVDRLRAREAAAMAIVREVAAIRESGTGYASIDAQPYDAQISALTIMRARVLLTSEEAH